MIVIDASAMVEWLEHSAVGVKVNCKIVAQSEALHAPHLIDVEVMSSIRRRVLLGGIEDVRATQILWDLAHTPCIRYSHRPFLKRMWELRHSVTAYDALYIALAEFLSADLLTCDAKLAGTHGHKARVELVM